MRDIIHGGGATYEGYHPRRKGRAMDEGYHPLRGGSVIMDEAWGGNTVHKFCRQGAPAEPWSRIVGLADSWWWT